MTVAVVTAIYGGYDTLKPAGDAPGVEWVCVTDDQKLRDEPQGWQVIYEPRNGVHPNRAAKRPKMLPWCYTGADASVWIDASFIPAAPDFPRALLDHAEPIAQFAHPDRDCIYDEAAFSVPLSKYRGQPLAEQVEHYRAIGHPEHWGLWATGVIARRHTDAVIDFGWRWLADCECFTYQDQVSEAPALARAGLRPSTLPGHFVESPWLRYEPSGRH